MISPPATTPFGWPDCVPPEFFSCLRILFYFLSPSLQTGMFTYKLQMMFCQTASSCAILHDETVTPFRKVKENNLINIFLRTSAFESGFSIHFSHSDSKHRQSLEYNRIRASFRLRNPLRT